MKPHNRKLSSVTPTKHLCKSTCDQNQDKAAEKRQKGRPRSVMYIQNGSIVERHRATPKKPKRRRGKQIYLPLKKEVVRHSLDMTRVSIPKRALRRYESTEHHCKKSIKMNSLSSDVLIQPLSGSETNSNFTLPPVEVGDDSSNLTVGSTMTDDRIISESELKYVDRLLWHFSALVEPLLNEGPVTVSV